MRLSNILFVFFLLVLLLFVFTLGWNRMKPLLKFDEWKIDEWNWYSELNIPFRQQTSVGVQTLIHANVGNQKCRANQTHLTAWGTSLH